MGKNSFIASGFAIKQKTEQHRVAGPHWDTESDWTQSLPSEAHLEPKPICAGWRQPCKIPPGNIWLVAPKVLWCIEKCILLNISNQSCPRVNKWDVIRGIRNTELWRLDPCYSGFCGSHWTMPQQPSNQYTTFRHFNVARGNDLFSFRPADKQSAKALEPKLQNAFSATEAQLFQWWNNM